ncbi:related to BCS1 protein precursor [Phialocephala subalpina]|uniref:Related to BCS1 protein n=1 Tax=Phialocephala subalpina TaxID=576137 RepID=A0A1L7XQ83_9HELO|nr:related to BCS1 protein precursor [Phialocephala subalpina]
MAESSTNGSLPMQLISDAQASILDFVLFPGFTRISAAFEEHLTVDLNFYVPLLCIFGLLVFICRHIYECLLGLLETYFTSTVHLRYRDEAYDMFIMWTASQSFTQHARSSLATTELSSTSARPGRSNDGDTKQKTIYYTPWNGRFFIWYNGYLLVFRREYRAGEFNSREEVSVSCFSRSPRILKELLNECCMEYSKFVHDKTSLYEHRDGTWVRSIVSDVRSISTVILNESKKRELLKDIEDFLDEKTRRWYSNRGVPYRRGYLLYGPPGTGKSSLSLSIAGHFGLNIYILSLSTVTEDRLRDLFAKLPSRCIILLEDIDAVSPKRPGDTETKDSHQIVAGSPSQRNKSVSVMVSLSALLNVIDGVGSREGRVLIMTTNHITRLDDALIRPGRVDRKFELGLTDKKMTAGLFCIVFMPMEDDVPPPEKARSDVLVRLVEDRKVDEAARSQGEEVKRVERLAEEFAGRVPELKFSPAELLSFLLEYRQSPEEAIDNVEKWMTRIREERE